jgi:hypothetical protein
MSRKVINILFIAGSCVYIPGFVLVILGYVFLFQSTIHHTYGSGSLDGFGTFFGLIMSGFALVMLGAVGILVARIGALMELAKSQEWVWFVLMIIFNWVVLFVYLIAGPKPKAELQYAGAYPYPGQPWQGYQPAQAPAPAQPTPIYQASAERQETPEKPED